ncbi:methyltransferase-like protein 22 isoform X2 [Sorghum bicolor]|uniref:methyltransferase-like protein 22 isoform X2 n=1 Tax=Sorghum bicolor TaxID=4558 RepID=UPI000B425A27|nr:methyltransferase-like protein 22 isoform X2 [Sorghum bicolor]|eukprot:XP_021304260.1 methyltransferase-like protein 22 isoform X2 [Sorghum bicolor]
MAQLFRPPAACIPSLLLTFRRRRRQTSRGPTADHDGSRRRRSRGGAGDERGAPGLPAALLRPPRLPLQLLLTARPSGDNDGGGGDGSELVAATSGSFAVDEDGDLVLDRRRGRNKYVRSDCHLLTIQHGVTSSLKSVGLQVWKAALLLADFVLHKSFSSSNFDGVTAIEIGAGTGLVGLALAPVARRIFVTDRGTDILDNCLANVHINSGMLKFDEAKVCVRELDWKTSWPPPVGTYDPSDPSRYLWSASEVEEAEKATVLFAADVIYSDDLTDLFFDTVKKLMSSGAKKVLYLALEKRYNFSLDELDVVANGYMHFRSFFTAQDGHGDPIDGYGPGFVGKQIDPAEIPQYIREYERGKDLEMWMIMYSPDQKQQ